MSDLPPPNKQRRPDPLKGEREVERLSAGAFFADHKAMVDQKRHHLDRLGMDPRHVSALRMPELAEPPTPVEGAPALQFVEADPFPTAGDASTPPPVEMPARPDDELPTGFSPKRPPRVEGVRGAEAEES